MTRIIGIIFEKKIGKEKANELIKKLKGEDEEMLAVIEMIRKENQMYIDIGIKRGIKKGEKEKQINIIKNMLAEGLLISLISKITKSDEKEILFRESEIIFSSIFLPVSSFNCWFITFAASSGYCTIYSVALMCAFKNFFTTSS